MQDWAVQYWLQHGTPPDKMVLGIPAYGRSFMYSPESRSSGQLTGLSALGAGQAGAYTGEAGFLAYYEVIIFP